MLSHVELLVSTSMIILVGIFLNGSVFQVSQVLSLMVRMIFSISSTCSSSSTMLSLIWSYVSQYCSGSNSLLEFQSVIRKPMWEYMF